jgi:plastocyanin
MRRRHLLAASAAFALTLGSVASGTVGAAAEPEAPQRSHEPNRVLVLGSDTFETNTLIQSTYRFSPERSYPHTGERIRWVDEDGGNDPHTVTIVRRTQLPTEFADLFACPACNEALDAHFAAGQPDLRVNVGAPGLDQPGDSLLLLADAVIGAPISAPAGTNLSYLCAIHPWMQGRIVVG